MKPSDSDHGDPRERRLRNLNAVASHLASQPDGQTSQPVVDKAARADSDLGRVPQAKSKSGDKSSATGKFLKRWGPIGVVLAIVLSKAKLALPLLKVAKFSTLLSMLLAVWVYATIWGFSFALGFVLLIFVHEMGHALVMRQQGIHAGAPVFIPFVGAVIAMKGMPRDAYVEALVGIGGPALGTAGAIVCLLVGWASGSLFWYALAYTGFLINLFNMIPISPLDGGRIVGVISRWIWVAGYAVGIAVLVLTKSPILFLILLLGLFTLGRTVRGPHRDYYEVPPAQRIRMGFLYFGLMAIMALGMWIAQEPLAGITPGANQN